MAVAAQTFQSDDSRNVEPHAAGHRGTAAGLLKLLAAGCVVALAGCAQNPAPRAAANSAQLKSSSQLKTASASVTPAPRGRAEHRDAQARIRKLDPALLAPQPAPNCEYQRSDLKTVDPDAWARLKAEYELHCYRETEEATRTRLGLLQSSIKHLAR